MVDGCEVKKPSSKDEFVENPGPCPRITQISDQLLLGGLGGGLSPEAIGVLLQEHAVTHLCICGRRDADPHVAAAEAAAATNAASLSLHVASLLPEMLTDVPKMLRQAADFVDEALEDDFSTVLIACSKGASRSVAVLLTHMMQKGKSLEGAFSIVAEKRWRVWPSALLVNALLDFEGKADVSSRGSTQRQIGAHAAWATAWHNGCQVSQTAAKTAWDEAQTEAPEEQLEAAFARCKRKLLGLSSSDLEAYADGGKRPKQAMGKPPHTQVNTICEGMLICGLGGLSAAAVASLLQQHSIQRVVICGRPEKDAHVTALKTAVSESEAGLSEASVHVVPVADSDAEDILSHLQKSVCFVGQGTGNVLVACRQGASRSATVAIACLMKQNGSSALEAFKQLAKARWRLWPNAGFVRQLLKFEDVERSSLNLPPLSENDHDALFQEVGIHAAWASNRQNLEETGFGQEGLSLEDVEELWQRAAEESQVAAERFERCKALALGVDLSAFGEADAEQHPKKARTE
eukprot:TRINITY_DN78648_c0_g1_i1.p1 TRINITY_DN78648_c0_g1~~TRINITY_DN78648_c0_g1_i1.p1  ORF type:complete len:539 (+),score=130.82 TRINITY_DN78648_c0_g1_i1:61-1617(+)